MTATDEPGGMGLPNTLYVLVTQSRGLTTPDQKLVTESNGADDGPSNPPP